MSNWTCSPIFDNYWLVFGLTGLLLLLLFVKPRFPNATPARRRGLFLLRMLVILLVMLAMLRPTIIRSESKPQLATVALLLDASRSMTLPSISDEASRWQVAVDSLRKLQPYIDGLGETYQVETYLFDERSRKVAFWDENGDVSALPDAPVGEESDIATSLDEVVRGLTGRRLAGVFLLSDGVQRAITPRVDMQQPARELARRECPLWTTSFGQARDKSESRDVAIENLPDQYTVFANNELEVRAAVRVQGMARKAVPVELRVTGPDGTMETIGPISVFADTQDEQLEAKLLFTPTVPGAYRLTVRAAPPQGEQDTDNNELTAFATVLEGGLRVLYVDGNIGWQERKFIRRSLDASPDIDVDVWLDTRRNPETPIALPWDKAADYDVFVIGDIDATALGKRDNAVKIANAVSEGKGLMTLGGVFAYGPGGYAASPLKVALPVEMNPLDRQPRGEPIRKDVHYTDELQMLPQQDHFVLRLTGTSPQANEARWRQLPVLNWANRFQRLGDQAVVLASASTPTKEVPLLVAGSHGEGRVLSFAADSTHRWYRYGFIEEHRRFWRQSMLWLAKKDREGESRVSVQLAQRRYSSPTRVPLTVRAYNELGDLVTDVEWAVQLTAPDGTSANVQVALNGEEFTGTSESLTEPGDYKYTVVAKREGVEFGRTSSEFQVIDHDLELTDAAANPAQLASLAAATADYGGRLVAAEELPLILQQLADREVTSEVAYESQWRLGDTSRDAGGLFAFVVGLLVIEWFLRKSWGLV